MNLRKFLDLYFDLWETLRSKEYQEKHAYRISLNGSETGRMCITITGRAYNCVSHEMYDGHRELMQIIKSGNDTWIHYRDYWRSLGFADLGHSEVMKIVAEYGDCECDYDEVSDNGDYKTSFIRLKDFNYD